MKTILLAALFVCLMPTPMTRAADTAAPPVAPAKLTAFMEKWKTYEAFKYPQDAADQPLLLAAMAKDPAGPWSTYLFLQFTDLRCSLRKMSAPERPAAAAKAVVAMRQTDQILAASVPKAATNKTELESARAMLRETMAPFLLEAGPNYLAEARAQGETMLAHLPATNAWDYGNVIYAANQLLGRVALREGRLKEARDYLRKAGQSPGSPQLNSFGPDNQLARELLLHGEPADREAVLDYVTDCAHFGPTPRANDARSERAIADHLKRLDQWKDTIRAGKIPDDPAWK